MPVGDGTPGPGRPKGSVSQITKEFLAFGQDIFDSVDWKASATARILAGKADHLEQYFAHRIHGKPKEKIEIESSLPLFALPVGASIAVMRSIEADAEQDGVPDALDGVKS